MHAEFNLNAQNNSAQQNEQQSYAEDTQSIFGRKVACALVSTEQDKVQPSD